MIRLRPAARRPAKSFALTVLIDAPPCPPSPQPH